MNEQVLRSVFELFRRKYATDTLIDKVQFRGSGKTCLFDIIDIETEDEAEIIIKNLKTFSLTYDGLLFKNVITTVSDSESGSKKIGCVLMWSDKVADEVKKNIYKKESIQYNKREGGGRADGLWKTILLIVLIIILAIYLFK